jgi:hypothetical protein
VHPGLGRIATVAVGPRTRRDGGDIRVVGGYRLRARHGDPFAMSRGGVILSPRRMPVAENTKSRFGFHTTTGLTNGRGDTSRQYRVRSIVPIHSCEVVNVPCRRCRRVRNPQENHRIGVAETPPKGSARVGLLYAFPRPVALKARIAPVPEGGGYIGMGCPLFQARPAGLGRAIRSDNRWMPPSQIRPR